MNHILYSYRMFHNWEQSDVAKALEIPEIEYADIEAGAEVLDAGLAHKLAALYKAPPFLFLAEQQTRQLNVFISNNHFEGSNGYVNNLNQHSTELLKKLFSEKEESITELKAEILSLREQNNLLLQKLSGRL